MLSKSVYLSLAASVAALGAFASFLAEPVNTPIGVLLGLAVLPTAEASKASAEIFHAFRSRLEATKPNPPERRKGS